MTQEVILGINVDDQLSTALNLTTGKNLLTSRDYIKPDQCSITYVVFFFVTSLGSSSCKVEGAYECDFIPNSFKGLLRLESVVLITSLIASITKCLNLMVLLQPIFMA